MPVQLNRHSPAKIRCPDLAKSPLCSICEKPSTVPVCGDLSCSRNCGFVALAAYRATPHRGHETSVRQRFTIDKTLILTLKISKLFDVELQRLKLNLISWTWLQGLVIGSNTSAICNKQITCL
ncbi:hypothetical protein ACFE04_016249 [Oxalis oulophora]